MARVDAIGVVVSDLRRAADFSSLLGLEFPGDSPEDVDRLDQDVSIPTA